MAVKRDRIGIEVIPASAQTGADQTDPSRANAAILSLARLIGRQIAREQFERKIAQGRKAQR
ncbi:hypothetical protein K9B32_16330 [Rhizobium sp. 3T7]|uniref:hypothetical protein n=1 Tax=Rhizobium sp. 3T7 TaxID=2874922 RepID=UPI001CCD620B|nr:hypothetical protein [Rhizobium sp. 3T7]MBZ9791674.1 hypothetical protein [Rhizobium sp. 3T7]